MKKTYFILAFFIVTSISYAEEETLLNSNLEYGYYVGPVLKLTQFNTDPDMLVGWRGGLIFGKSFFMGLSGYGMMSGFQMHGYNMTYNHDHGNKHKKPVERCDYFL